MIADIRARNPDVIFLAEAFTRPKMMYRLAKIGFSQSYTYFTWRNTKQELTEYFSTLTTTEVKEFFRPHLFVNTPDINSYFLQTSGRRLSHCAALAATLSGLWGMYSGFELCEAAPLPGREEYLDSEKYQIAPAITISPETSPPRSPNSTASAGRIRRCRRIWPAFLSGPQRSGDLLRQAGPARPRHDPRRGQPRSVSLQETTIEVPLWEWKLPDDTTFAVSDLMRGTATVWIGKLQRIRLDPFDLPFAIWRIAPSRA